MKLLIHSENAEYQIIESLKLNRVKRAKARELFIEGIESIKQAIKARVEISRIIITNSNTISDWAKEVIAKNRDAKIIEMAPELYNKLCDRNNPSEMLVTAKIDPWPSALQLADLRLPEKPFILLFDRPSDGGNLGSILRSANAFNADALFVMGHAVDIYDPKVIRASLGSIFYTPTLLIPSLNEIEAFIQTEKAKNNMTVLGTDSGGELSLPGLKLKRPIMLIIGNEAKGISVALKALCDGIIRIPITGDVNSLNVASAASIVMWEVYKNTLNA
ncbi:tRNA/rRNA methyltransferase [Spirochaetia bacterium]|nr:tRNA/rRNA methyltransferase [Spirochaetia bacterium]